MIRALLSAIRACWWLGALSAAACTITLLAPAPHGASVRAEEGSTIDPSQACLGCHAGAGESLTFPSGETLSMDLDVTAYRVSVHGARLDCVDCHERHREYPHPAVRVRTRRDYARAEYETCYRCHVEQYTRSLDSSHFDAMVEMENAAVG